ncbi:hypothetical protein D3C73_1360420 [compost metagenome]
MHIGALISAFRERSHKERPQRQRHCTGCRRLRLQLRIPFMVQLEAQISPGFQQLLPVRIRKDDLPFVIKGNHCIGHTA